MVFLDDNPMNKELEALYSTMPQDLVQYILDYNATRKPDSKGRITLITNPFWLKVPEEYATAKKRILMINQETYRWHGEFSSKSTNKVMQYYATFIENVLHHYKKPTPIWDKFRDLYTLALKQGIAIIPNNIGKIGYGRKTKQGEYEGCNGFKKEGVNFHHWVNDVFFKEIEILKPDLILFFCGPKYDKYIDRRFEDNGLPKPKRERVLADISSRQFAQLEVPGFPPMYRTYHPGYLRRNSGEPWVKAINAEIERLIKSL